MDKHDKTHWLLESASSIACISFSKSKLEWTDYLIDNVYIEVVNNAYQHTIGIPQQSVILSWQTVPVSFTSIWT